MSATWPIAWPPTLAPDQRPGEPRGELQGQVAIVTGAAQGIGLRISEMLAANGATVVLADLQAIKARSQAAAIRSAGGRAWSIALDIGRPESSRRMVRRTLARFGRIDCLVNNAGIDAPLGEAWTEPDEHWRRIIDLDLSGAWWCTKAVLPSMIAAGRGRVVLISSVAARRGSPTISVAYNSAKAGLLGLTIALATQVEQHGVLVNAIAPGPTGNTGQTPGAAEKAAYLAAYPLGFGGPDPIAHACLYLLRSSGDWISGSVLNVSGGGWKG